MNACPKLLLLAAGFLGLITSAMNAAPLRVLYFTKSSGYEHSVVKRENGQPSYSERVLTKLGAAHDIAFAFSKDGSKFSPEFLAQFDAVMFYTTGDLLTAGTDGQPPMTAAGKQALLDWVAAGHGFLALHSGSDTFHTNETGGGNPPANARENRYKNFGEKADAYIRMLGGEFINHDAQQVANARVIDPHFPGCSDLGEAISVMEEWYSLKEFAPNLHVLLVLDTHGMQGPDYQRAPYPLSWARSYGQGRVWFNAMGHREDVWDNPKFQSMLVGGLNWAGGRVKADVTPNLAEAAPDANKLQPLPPHK